MKVYASRFYELYDKRSKEIFGKSWPIGMSVMAATMIFITIFLFFVGFIPSLIEPNVKFRWMGMFLWFFIAFFSIYFSYDVYGNYLYYKGIWKDPPFAKSSLKKFWKRLKKGKSPYLLLTERRGECTVFYFLPSPSELFNRGVDVELCDDEMDEIGRKWIKKLNEDKERLKELIFEYEKYGIRGLRIMYKDGKEIRLGRKEAEILGFLYYLGGTDYKFIANAGALRKIRATEKER